MRKRWQWIVIGMTVPVFFSFGFLILPPLTSFEREVIAQATPTPVFDQAAELAKLRESIKGRENEPAEKVFKNLQMTSFKAMPASRILAVMEMGFSRSLGVNCTHCHVPGKFEADDKPTKQTAREMWAMVQTLNGQTLKGIKTIANPNPTVNCTTCHRGEIKPALNLTQR
jgi:hypothetical protein